MKSADRNGPGRRSFRLRAAVAAGLGLVLLAGGQAQAESRFAVIPKQIIYPGEELDASHLEEVPVTNPNLVEGYASSIDEIAGLVSKRTLLPGRVILTSALREQFAVQRGSAVRLVFNNGPMTITAGGSPLQDAAIGDFIKVRNTDSGIVVSGTVMADGTVHVVAK
ncbi:flagellar basal body P-ring formation chaperone FlgA [Pararhizobium sp.]|uniref:flagellar basal body P-ring formation chaperone FlgA n=1 Tax=Pararhizobium sp. TaxID=1977563 RepID=UPI002724D72B|nr:flagellar basal body P-ring formation chaperone FlgA [Pararhizobium sp.]MDO9416062.1 flagellar basal body P-ring formation chaperone FlgA [Pararhizobium sp.]